MAANPRFKALHFLSHMDLKKEVRKNSFSNPAFSVSFLQNKLVNPGLRNISFLFQKLSYLPSSEQPRKTRPTPGLWQSQMNLLASQESCPVAIFFLTFSNLHVLNDALLKHQHLPSQTVSLRSSHIFLYYIWARRSTENLVLFYIFLSWKKKRKTQFLNTDYHFISISCQTSKLL